MGVLFPLHFAVHVTIALLLVPELIAMEVGRGSLENDWRNHEYRVVLVPIVAVASIFAILIM
jgi:hypothetical protein